MKRLLGMWFCLLVFVPLFVLYPVSTHGDSYTYDGAGRLAQVTYDNGSTITYTYDLAGNLLQRVLEVELSLADAIRALQVLTEVASDSPIYEESDMSKDGKIGLEEVFYILQKMSDVR